MISYLFEDYWKSFKMSIEVLLEVRKHVVTETCGFEIRYKAM